MSALRSWYMFIQKDVKVVELARTLIVAALLATACSRDPEGFKEEECSDNIDNDGDRKYDCEDDGCVESAICIEQSNKAEKARKEAVERQKKTPVEAQATEKDESLYVEVEGLLVQKGNNGSDVDQIGAAEYCNSLILGGAGGWRLPNQEEAIAVVKSGSLPSEPYVMWTSSMKGKKTGKIVGITSGAVNDLEVGYKGQCRARCVKDAKQ